MMMDRGSKRNNNNCDNAISKTASSAAAVKSAPGNEGGGGGHNKRSAVKAWAYSGLALGLASIVVTTIFSAKGMPKATNLENVG